MDRRAGLRSQRLPSMADLKEAVKERLFGGKLKFRSDMDEQNEVVNPEVAPEAPAEEVKEETSEEAVVSEESPAESAEEGAA